MRVSAPFRNAVLVTTGRRKVFYGWWLLAGSVVGMAIGSGVSFWAFGLYIEPLEEEFGWSRASVSLGFSISFMVSSISGLFVGRWIDRKGPRTAIIIGTVLTSASYLLLATTSTLWQWWLYLTFNSIFRQMMFFIPFQALMSRWFDRKRGLALGILGTGFSLGGFIVVPAFRVVIDQVGWAGSFVVSGFVILALYLFLGVVLVRNHPSEVGAMVDGDPMPKDGRPPPARELTGLTPGQAIRTPFFWVLAGAFMLLFYGMFGWLLHQVPFYESVGISRGGAAALVSATAGFGIVTRLTFGVFVDRMARMERAAVALVVVLVAGMATLLISTSPAAIAVFIACWVLGSSGGALLEAMLLTRAFGVKHFASILALMILVETTGEVASPAVAGLIYDVTGTYDWALVMFVCSFAASGTLFFIASRMRYPVTLLTGRRPDHESAPAALPAG